MKKRIPVDSGKKNYIAKMLSEIITGEEYLLYIDEYGIWPSSENIILFDGYRSSIGVTESLEEKPAHIFFSNEKEELYCILCMILFFCWGAILVFESCNVIVRISHDEYIDCYVKENQLLNEKNKKLLSCINEMIS